MGNDLLTETQIGAVCENLVANLLVMSSQGRLSPFKPYADDGGVDLLIFDKVTRRTMACQVKGRTKTIRRFPNRVYFQLRAATFDERNHMLAVLFDWPRQTIECSWLIPMTFFVGRSAKRGKYVIQPSKSATSTDMFSGCRHNDVGSLAQAIIQVLEGDG